MTLHRERPNETAAETTLKLVVLAGATLHRSRSSATWRSPYPFSMLPPPPPPRASDSLPCRRWHYLPLLTFFRYDAAHSEYIQRAALCRILPANDDAVTIRREDLRRKLRKRGRKSGNETSRRASSFTRRNAD